MDPVAPPIDDEEKYLLGFAKILNESKYALSSLKRAMFTP